MGTAHTAVLGRFTQNNTQYNGLRSSAKLLEDFLGEINSLPLVAFDYRMLEISEKSFRRVAFFKQTLKTKHI